MLLADRSVDVTIHLHLHSPAESDREKKQEWKSIIENTMMPIIHLYLENNLNMKTTEAAISRCDFTATGVAFVAGRFSICVMRL